MNREELFAATFAGAVVPPDLSLELALARDVVCHVGLYWRSLVINDEEVPVAGIGGVVTAEGFRRQGLAGAFLQTAHTVARNAGLGLAALFCNEYAFRELYHGHGYAFADGAPGIPPIAGWPPNLAIAALHGQAVIPYSGTVEEPPERW